MRGIENGMRNQDRPAQPSRGSPGHFALRPGTRVTVRHCANSYRLPEGLAPGDWVRIVSFDRGYYSVEKAGKTFTVFMMNVIH